MKNLTLEHITQVCGGTYYGPADKMQEEVQSVVTDKQKADKGCLFVPIVGEGRCPQIYPSGDGSRSAGNIV